MSRLFTRVRVVESSVIAVVIVLLLLLSPLADFWTAVGAPWYAPYLIWLVIIFLTFLLQRYLTKHAL